MTVAIFFAFVAGFLVGLLVGLSFVTIRAIGHVIEILNDAKSPNDRITNEKS